MRVKRHQINPFDPLNLFQVETDVSMSVNNRECVKFKRCSCSHRELTLAAFCDLEFMSNLKCFVIVEKSISEIETVKSAHKN